MQGEGVEEVGRGGVSEGWGDCQERANRSVTTELLLLLEDRLGTEDNASSLSVQWHTGHLVISRGGGGGGSYSLQR